MAVPKDANRKKVQSDLVACGRACDIALLAGFIFAIAGVVADVANVSLGLEYMSWLLLAIGAFLAAIVFRIGWAVSWYLTTSK